MSFLLHDGDASMCQVIVTENEGMQREKDKQGPSECVVAFDWMICVRDIPMLKAYTSSLSMVGTELAKHVPAECHLCLVMWMRVRAES